MASGLACTAGGLVGPPPTPHLETAIPLPTLTFTPAPPTSTLPPTETPLVTGTPPISATSTPPPSPTPYGCAQRPMEDYQRIPVREWVISQRTMSMLLYAQTLYDGPNDLLLGITQGSYNPGVEHSFGTHDEGGAVDLTVYNMGPEAGRLSPEQIEVLVQALRGAGFAAWYRAPDDLYSGSPPHVHAIAIGDAELSEAAQEQLTGDNGYFRGRNGLPDNRGGPDPHGGPVVCPWMVEMGYMDMSQTLTP